METNRVRKQDKANEFAKDDNFFDFDKDILKDLISQGYEGQELTKHFSEVKKAIPKALDKLVEDAKVEGPLTKEEATKEFGI